MRRWSWLPLVMVVAGCGSSDVPSAATVVAASTTTASPLVATVPAGTSADRLDVTCHDLDATATVSRRDGTAAGASLLVQVVAAETACTLTGAPIRAEVDVGGTWRTVDVVVTSEAPPAAGAAVGLTGASWFAQAAECSGASLTATRLRLVLGDRVTITASAGTQPPVVVGCDGTVAPLAVSTVGSFVGYG